MLSHGHSVMFAGSDGRRMKKYAKGSIKLAYLVVGVVFLMLGVIGLILPVIPGVLFLMAALYLLNRGSRRIRRFTEQNPRMKSLQQRLDRMADIKVADRIRVVGWMMLDTTVQGARTAALGIRRVVRGLGRRVSSS